ncbi:LacI family DNA-binding transcriptional regulator [Desulfosarcina ovata]|uniref:LacI family transcriptional regulator n=2 Tax=Desulfosarcina ovata TaxID=83564 RepID=A0A5K8A425_9BACT|nr:LacI family DNA-binding transcriptional regulator [Desulfosarcina ovata]BBO87197.1 LacI family transcriptional regulator [Desulfosarcina ovata subsp. ovata]
MQESKPTKTTIKDIAQAAGVTPTTVSLALNNRPGVSKKTREKIFRLAETLNYEPNFTARSLRSKRSYTLGLFMKNIADPFYPQLAKSISETANDCGYNVILCNVGDDVDLKVKHLKILRGKGVDGIIFTTMLDDDPYVIQLIEESFPFVTAVRHIHINGMNDQIVSVTVDNFSGAYQAIQHLYRLGHDRIGIIAGDERTSTMVDRTAGAGQALLDCGIEPDGKMIAKCNYSRKLAMAATRDFLAMKYRPSAFFAEDDTMAIGVREAVLKAGLRIPEDIALVGFDDIDVAGITGIELTTINQQIIEIGRLSVNLLVDRIEKKSAPLVSKIVLQPELVIRKSCGFHLKGYRTDRVRVK